jgi:hypothetical protein
MKAICSLFFCLAALALAGCNGTAVVTLTSTASSDGFLVYRVGLQAIELDSADGASTLTLLPSGSTLDLAGLGALHEVVAAASASNATYTRATLTLDYFSAQIIYDDGSLDGLALTALDRNGAQLGRIVVAVNLDANAPLGLATASVTRLALDFKMAASNRVDASAQTVTVTPLIAASATASDSKLVRARGPLQSFNVSGGAFTQGVAAFDSTQAGLGTLIILPNANTTYEVNGSAAIGAAGFAQLGALASGTTLVSFGTLATRASSTPVDGTEAAGAASAAAAAALLPASTPSAAAMAYTISQVLAGSSVEGGGFDRVTGSVSARSGDTLTLENAALRGNDGTESLLPGTSVVRLGASTLITLFGAGAADLVGPGQISVGSRIEAFGNFASASPASAVLDASAGRVRIDATRALGLLASVDSSMLTFSLQRLNGRSVSALDFVGTGSTSLDAVPAAYTAAVTGLDVSNLAPGAPVNLEGRPAGYGLAPPDFTASSLAGPDGIEALLVIDWSAGTATPFTALGDAVMQIDAGNAAIGSRHMLRVGALAIDIAASSPAPLITPGTGTGASFVVYAIGHAATDSVENFDHYADFVARLRSELGSALALGLTASGQYSAGAATLQASSITVFLND